MHVARRNLRAIPSPTDLIDLDRYPVGDLESAGRQKIVAEGNAALREEGVCILPGFLRGDVIDGLVEECEALAPLGHFSQVSGTPYIEAPDASYPEGHPRRIARADLAHRRGLRPFPADSPIRAAVRVGPS